MHYARILLFFLVVLLVGYATSASAARFTDLQGSGYNTAITTLADAGIIHGHPDGSVEPFNILNRAEALKVILSLDSTMQSEVSFYQKIMPPLPLFSDVQQSAWYGPYVEVGFQHGIVKGYPDGSFKPGKSLTVEEAIALLMRSYGKQSQTFMSQQQLTNMPNQWFTSSINAAHQRNIISSRETLVLGNPITRGQFFDMVYRMREVETKHLTAYKETIADSSPITGSWSNPNVVAAGNTNAVAHASTKDFAISLPSLGISDLEIHHPDDPFTSEGVLSVLDKGVGHLFSYPGEGGKIMVYGHSSGYPWDISEYTKIFRRINELNTGDKAYVTYNGKVYVYEVVKEETVDVEDSRPFEPDEDGEELILYTCWPPDTVDERYLVYLRPVETVALNR